MLQISGTDTTSNVAKLKIQHHTINVFHHVIRKGTNKFFVSRNSKFSSSQFSFCPPAKPEAVEIPQNNSFTKQSFVGLQFSLSVYKEQNYAVTQLQTKATDRSPG
jgi:hypothetical protein